ncbi:hypothetical protein LDENG_00032780 [Lucifuga dentata]|nr:hypothetical protein LDENG_00032780 [Lucifuga dentata]
MVFHVLLLLSTLWIHSLTLACREDERPREAMLVWVRERLLEGREDERPREAMLVWVRERLLEGLGLEEPPVPTLQGPDGDTARPQARQEHRRSHRMGRTAWINHNHHPHHEISQIILFPSADSSCVRSDPAESTKSHFTFYFQPSMSSQENQVTSAHFWFYAGEAASNNASSSSSPLFMLTSSQQLHQAAEAPWKTSVDGWSTYHLHQDLHASVSEGPFVLQVRCPTCQCHANEPDKTPFLHLHARPRSPARSHRAASIIPWSPSAINLLQRPSQERPRHSDCQRAQIQISFEELGWDNWIVHPKVLTFHYCHGNCSAPDRTTAMLGITQCCAPVPGTMKSLRITTTSDGGYSFKYETLPNIIPEECTCI